MMKMRDFRWTKKCKRVPEVERIFKAMWRYYDFYLEEAGDLPYWSTEMALVGNLAIASAQSGFPAALEFYREGPRRKRLQRADLWLGFSSRKDLLIEAKRDWLSMNSAKKTITANVGWYLDEADKYLRKYLRALGSINKSLKPIRYASLFFAQVYLPQKDFEKNYPNIKDKLLSACEEASHKEKVSFYAYYFIRDRKTIVRFKDPEDSSCYPGIIIFGRISSAKTLMKRG